jgi:hypothetical protein
MVARPLDYIVVGKRACHEFSSVSSVNRQLKYSSVNEEVIFTFIYLQSLPYAFMFTFIYIYSHCHMHLLEKLFLHINNVFNTRND